MNIRQRQNGFSLIELLISIVIFSIGLLGIAGLQMVSKKSNYEGIQRTIASQVAYGMLEDMRANGSGISIYAAAPDLGGNKLAGLPVSNCRNANTPCSPAQKAGHDLWYWERILDGAQEVGTEGQSGGIAFPTLCIDGPAGGLAGIYTVSIAWLGSMSLSDPEGSACGSGNGKYGDGDANRRVLQVTTFIDPNF
jgi:type IV pilus assembly protein PilV